MGKGGAAGRQPPCLSRLEGRRGTRGRHLSVRAPLGPALNTTAPSAFNTISASLLSLQFCTSRNRPSVAPDMPLDVPEDVLYVLCDRLAEVKDFDTLFQCTLSGKRFAVPALTTLYRY